MDGIQASGKSAAFAARLLEQMAQKKTKKQSQEGRLAEASKDATGSSGRAKPERKREKVGTKAKKSKKAKAAHAALSSAKDDDAADGQQRRPALLGLGAKPSVSVEHGKHLNKTVRKHLQKSRRRAQDSDEEEVAELDVVEKAFKTKQKPTKVADPLEELLSGVQAQKEKKRQKRLRKKGKAKNADAIETPSGNGKHQQPHHHEKGSHGHDAAVSSASETNPFLDPGFDAEKEQTLFASNWVDDASFHSQKPLVIKDENDVVRDDNGRSGHDDTDQAQRKRGKPSASSSAAPSAKASVRLGQKGKGEGEASDASIDRKKEGVSTAVEGKRPKRKRPKKRSKQKNKRHNPKYTGLSITPKKNAKT